MPKRGRSRKKNRTHQQNELANSPAAQPKKVPQSLVVRRTRTSSASSDPGVLNGLVHDLRRLLQPYTALKFPESSVHSLKQLSQHLCLPMGVTHIFILQESRASQSSHTPEGVQLRLRLARTPSGPTMQFLVHKFSLARHVQALQKRPVAWTSALQQQPPVVVTHNFGSTENHIKLLRITLQNLFPPLNVATMKPTECRRVVLFQMVEVEKNDDNEEQASGSKEDQAGKQHRKQQMIEVRHYAISLKRKGGNRRMQRLGKGQVPNLANCRDVADYFGGYESAASSDHSDVEDIVLPQISASQKTALKLTELGPRLTLELTKVEKDLGDGQVLYHHRRHVDAAQAAAQQADHERAAELKRQRRTQQEANVRRKEEERKAKRESKRQRLDTAAVE